MTETKALIETRLVTEDLEVVFDVIPASNRHSITAGGGAPPNLALPFKRACFFMFIPRMFSTIARRKGHHDGTIDMVGVRDIGAVAALELLTGILGRPLRTYRDFAAEMSARG